MGKNKRTFVEAKKARGISEQGRERSKSFREKKKLIKKALETEPKSIPQIAAEINLPLNVVVFNLMTCKKYGLVEVEGMDDMDEYYLYSLKKTDKNGDED